MRATTYGLAASLLASVPAGQPAAQPEPIGKSIVYIECSSPDGKSTSRGTGVLVSANGHILTAKHVAPSGYRCLGGIGTAARRPDRNLIRDARQTHLDAMLLRFVKEPGEQFAFLRYRRIEDALQSQTILAHGFPGTGPGDVFVTNGIVSHTTIDERGIIGTTAVQSSGMSGGPVLLQQDGSLIGIIIGADFDPRTGSPASFGVLAAQEVAVPFELTAVPQAGPDIVVPLPPPPPLEVLFGPFTLAPGQARTIPIRLLQDGPVDVTIESIEPEPGWLAERNKSSFGVAVRICSAEASVDTLCPHSQLGAKDIARRHLPAGPANISVFNFNENPGLKFAIRVEGPLK